MINVRSKAAILMMNCSNGLLIKLIRRVRNDRNIVIDSKFYYAGEKLFPLFSPIQLLYFRNNISPSKKPKYALYPRSAAFI